MPTPPTAPPEDAPPLHAGLEHDDRSPTRRRVWLALGTLFAVTTLGLWFYAFFVYDPGRKVDELADPTFPRAAEQVCARALAAIEELPAAETARDARERADVVDRANVILTGMVAELRPLVPQGQGQVSEGIELWIDDWEVHVGDRVAYAEALRADSDARFLETRKARRQISRAIDGFAQVNRMPSCATPTDVG